jgi:PAS domain S-box-containing protein
VNGATPASPARRPGPAAAAALFVLVGIALLLVPELIAKFVAGEALDPTDFAGDLVFLAFGAAAVWFLVSRIEAAFGQEAAARQAVERRERVLADAIDAVPAAVLLLADTEELAVAHANPAAGRLLDLGPAEEQPRRLGAILPIDTPTLDAIAAALAARSRWLGERTITTESGRRVPLSLAVTPIESAGGVRAVLVAQDRTELRFAERESERLAVELEGFVQTAPVGFVTVGPDGTVAGWNAAAERILGWTANEMVGSRLPPELGAVVAESLAAGAGLPPAPRPASPSDSPDVRLRRATGQPVTVRLTATTAYGRGHDFFGFTAMFEDVTEARRIAAERDEAEARFRAAVDASPLPLVLLDPEGKVRLWSAAAERLFGWTADEAMGSVFPPVPDEGLAQFFARLQQVMDGELVVAERLRYVGRDGRVIPTRFWSAPVRASDGSLVGVMGACREEPDGEATGATMEADIQFAHNAPGGPPA